MKTYYYKTKLAKVTGIEILTIIVLCTIGMVLIDYYLFYPGFDLTLLGFLLVSDIFTFPIFYWIWYISFYQHIKYTYRIDEDKIEIISPKGIKTVYWATDLEDIIWQTFTIKNDLAGAVIITKDKYAHKVVCELIDYEEFLELLWNYTKSYLKNTQLVPAEIKFNQIK